MKFGISSKTKKVKSTEIFSPLHLLFANMQCREQKNGQQKVQTFKKTTVLYPSRCSYSMGMIPPPFPRMISWTSWAGLVLITLCTVRSSVDQASL